MYVGMHTFSLGAWAYAYAFAIKGAHPRVKILIN